MPTFLTPSGTTCSMADAMVGGRLRPGYREIVADGESVRFSLHMMDSARGGSVIADADRARDQAYVAMVRDLQDAWKPKTAEREFAEVMADAATAPETAYAAMVTANCTAWQRPRGA